jgi:hypothetical protein
MKTQAILKSNTHLKSRQKNSNINEKPLFSAEIGWQGQRASNPQPLVLETSALPIELCPYQVHSQFQRTKLKELRINPL